MLGSVRWAEHTAVWLYVMLWLSLYDEPQNDRGQKPRASTNDQFPMHEENGAQFDWKAAPPTSGHARGSGWLRVGGEHGCVATPAHTANVSQAPGLHQRARMRSTVQVTRSLMHKHFFGVKNTGNSGLSTSRPGALRFYGLKWKI
jgi:hypothetical protein